MIAIGDSEEALRARVKARVDDLELLAKLEEARLEGTAAKGAHFDYARQDRRYGELFRQGNFEVLVLPVAQAAERLRVTSVAAELAAVLDEWAGAAPKAFSRPTMRAGSTCSRLRKRPTRIPGARMRGAVERGDRAALVDLASSAKSLDLLPASLKALGSALETSSALEETVSLLRKAQRLHPGDFWINEQLGMALLTPNPGRATRG